MQTTDENNLNPAFYTVNDIQHFMGIGRNSAYKLVGENDFPAIYVGNRIIIPADLFQTWISKQAAQRKGNGINGKRP